VAGFGGRIVKTSGDAKPKFPNNVRLAADVVGRSRLMGKYEREDAPRPSDSIPFADIQRPQAMTAERRLQPDGTRK
jgi:hypothetical protein